MKILFIKPPFNKYVFVRHFSVCEPLEFEMLAAVVSDIHDVRIVDLRVDRHGLRVHLEEYEPDIVGFTALTMDVNTVRRLAKVVKAHRREIVTCVGGEHASLRPEDFETPEMDFIFQYDAVSTFPLLLQEIGRLRRTHGSKVVLHEHLHRRQHNILTNDDLRTAPRPRRDLCQQYLPRYTFGCANPVSLIQTTAGCPFQCIYCSIPARFVRYVKRPIDAILDDMAATQSTDLLSIDANALHDVTASIVLYKEIARANLGKRLMISCRTDTVVRHPEMLEVLRLAGVSVIAFGIETLDDKRLHDYQKHNTAENNRWAVRLAHEHGLLVRGNFIIDQQFTRDDFRRLANDVLQAEIEFPTFQILTPLPGTKFFEETKGQILTNDHDYFDLSHSVLPTKLPFEEFHEEFKKLFRICYGPRRLLWLASRVPLGSSIKGMLIALRSHLEFSYKNHLDMLQTGKK